jgi:ATP-dependent Lhr-like helicase
MQVDVVVPAEEMGNIWESVYPAVLAQVRDHRSTIIFCNARRQAERLAANLNELAGEELVKAHHGSLAREQRIVIEDELKRGTLRGIVATSSLELGIDMGAVDLVVQVESPGAVSRGMQRVGRAGHSVGEPSRGVLYPKHRGDLLEAAVVAQRMVTGQIETTRFLRNPLDVLAQQIVAHVSTHPECTVESVAAMVRRCANFAELSDDLLHNVLDLLSGRYPSDEFNELRPRLVWDRTGGTLRARDGSKRLAVTSGGTIPDRGLFGVFLPDGTRVGELDEEMVYESRPGETFMLGASTWRIEDITFERVTVTPAPGEQGKMPFWHGDRPGRPLELGRALGSFQREMRALDTGTAIRRLVDDYGLDFSPPATSVSYLDEQALATGAVPDDRTVIIERFRDEIGDWRVCILSPFGTPVHAPWAMAIERRLMDRYDMPIETMWSDDGIVLRLPEAADTVPIEELIIDPDDIDELVVSSVPQTSLFSGSLSGVRGACPVAAAPSTGSTHPVVATAAAGGGSVVGCRQVSDVPDPAGDIARVPARRVRSSWSSRCARPVAQPLGPSRQRRHRQGVAVRPEPAVQLDRRVHVRGRRAVGRAPRRGPVTRSRPVARPAGRRGAS